MRYRILCFTFLAIAAAFILASCTGSEQSSGQAAWYSRNTLYTYSGTKGNIWDPIRKNLRLPTYTYTPAVQQEIRWFQHNQAYLNHIITESAPYIYYIYQQTQKRHLPAELALIPVIESEYNPYARSRTGATGLWQMMPATARGFGLKRDSWYDGRKDIIASTNAALEYFSDLHQTFHNWPLAIAAYDCGEGTIIEAMRYNRYHGYGTNFWSLPLPNETRHYVPRLLAVAAIVKDPKRYHITLAPINDAPFLEQVNVGSALPLSKAAKLADVPESTLKVLNPGLQRGRMDPRGPYSILVPKDKADTLKIRLAAISHNERLVWQEHIVRSRETLAKIAKDYRTSIAMIKLLNNLNSDQVAPHQRLLIPAPGTQLQLATQETSGSITSDDNIEQTPVTKDDNNESDSHQLIYHVKAGNTLWKIADHFKVDEKQLIAWNNLNARRPLRVGQRLVIYIQNPIQQSSNNKTLSNKNSTETTSQQNNQSLSNHSPSEPLAKSYEVVKGDNLQKIAKRFATTVSQIRTANNLKSNVVQVGQVLAIPSNTLTSSQTTSDANPV